ncbi:porin [Avibacterium gallinarum]|uniref:GBP family porin n=1 Tax=Avibacterium gallinarum TaxID=755 RepID=A0A379AUS2_AVIGA|nr:porin [Avibacterium gallinarum]TDP27688.1 GBP family porin [Avibacterium gallinarum]SUB26086.1 major outer membrane protein OmpH-2 [Avibacterium gallinarum]
MKKSLSLLALSLLAATSTASAVEIYKKDGTSVQINGQFRPMLAHTEGERSDLRDRGSRVEFIFAQEMAENLRLIGKARMIFNGKDASGSNHSGFGDPRTAQLYLGVEHKSVGRLYLGRLPANGDAIMLGDWQLGGSGRNPLTASAEKGAHFRTVEFAGFQFGADYLFGSSEKGVDNSPKHLKNGYGLALYYTNKLNDDWRVRLRAGYTRDNYDSHQFSAPDSTGANKSWIEKDVNRSAWRVSGEVKYRNLEVAYNYGELKDLQRANYLDTNAVKEKRHFLAAKYFITPKFAGYSQFRYEKRGENVNHGYTLGLDYRPIKNLITFIEFGRDRNISNVNVHNKYVNQYYTGFRFLF